MERQILSKLEQWKNSLHRKPLILRGARQVGKTWVMKEFGKRFFKNFVYINFDNNAAMKAVFDSDFVPVQEEQILYEAGKTMK